MQHVIQIIYRLCYHTIQYTGRPWRSETSEPSLWPRWQWLGLAVFNAAGDPDHRLCHHTIQYIGRPWKSGSNIQVSLFCDPDDNDLAWQGSMQQVTQIIDSAATPYSLQVAGECMLNTDWHRLPAAGVCLQYLPAKGEATVANVPSHRQ